MEDDDFAEGLAYSLRDNGDFGVSHSVRSRTSTRPKRSFRLRSSKRCSRRGTDRRSKGNKFFGLVQEILPRVGKYEDQTPDEIRRKMIGDPDGNLYRGWAIGIQSGLWQLLMTCLVIFVQTFGSFAVVYWGFDHLCTGHFDLFWHSKGHELSYTVIFRKLLGVGLLMLVFINGENILERSDLQTDKLRLLFNSAKDRKIFWMWIDAFVNSWCIVFCALGAAPLLWTAEDGIKDIVLDSFGLLFLHNLDEFSSDIEYGIEVSDFDDLIDERQFELDQELALKDDEVRFEIEQKRLEGEWVHSCVCYGDMWFSVGRVINTCIACITLPAYATLIWFPDPPDLKASSDLLDVWGWQQLLVSAILCGLLVLWRIYQLCILDDVADIVTLDCIGIFIWLLVGRQDPRIPNKELKRKSRRDIAADVP